MAAAIQIGASVDTIRCAKASILDILKAPCGDKVKIEALKAFKDSVSVNHTSLNHVTITTGEIK